MWELNIYVYKYAEQKSIKIGITLTFLTLFGREKKKDGLINWITSRAFSLFLGFFCKCKRTDWRKSFCGPVKNLSCSLFVIDICTKTHQHAKPNLKLKTKLTTTSHQVSKQFLATSNNTHIQKCMYRQRIIYWRWKRLLERCVNMWKMWWKTIQSFQTANWLIVQKLVDPFTFPNPNQQSQSNVC